MTTAELRSSVLSLPTEERAALAHDLIIAVAHQNRAPFYWQGRAKR